MGIKTNELQQLETVLGTDSILMDSAAAGTGRVSAAALAQFMDQELLKPGTGLSTQLGKKAALSVQQTLEAASVPIRTVTIAASELQDYINALPRYLFEIVQLAVAGGEINQPLVLDCFFGPGYLSLSGEAAAGNLELKKGIIIRHCTAAIQIYSCELSGISTQSNPDVCSHVYDSRSVYFGQCCFSGNDDSNSCALSAYHHSHVTIDTCTISGWDRAAVVTTTSIVDAHDCTCSGNINGSQVWSGGIVLLSGTTPELMGGASHLLQGGMIVKADGTPYEPLELITFPYSSGITYEQGYGQYYWRQGRTVCLSVLAYLPACQKSQWLLIGTLPEGFRPEKTINDIAAIFRPDSVAAVEISSATGEVRVWPHVDIPNSGTSSYDKPYCFISTCFALSQ